MDGRLRRSEVPSAASDFYTTICCLDVDERDTKALPKCVKRQQCYLAAWYVQAWVPHWVGSRRSRSAESTIPRYSKGATEDRENNVMIVERGMIPKTRASTTPLECRLAKSLSSSPNRHAEGDRMLCSLYPQCIGACRASMSFEGS